MTILERHDVISLLTSRDGRQVIGVTLRIPDGFSADWQMVMLTSQPPSIPRTGYLFPIEDRQWMVTLLRCLHSQPASLGYRRRARDR